MVIDTHIFVWYLFDHPKLPILVRDQMERFPELVFVPSVCFWEMLMLVERGRISFETASPDSVIRKYFRETGFREAPLTAEIAIQSRLLQFNHEDPADRFIAATAKVMNLPLATSDHRLRGLNWLQLSF